MPGTVTTQLTNITLAETGDSANWDDIGGGPGSTQDDGAPVQGAEVRARRIDNTTARGFGFDNGAGIDLSNGEHVGFWVNVLQPSQIASFIELSISDSATSCQSGNWNGYQYPQANYPFQGGWIRVWVDPSLTRDSGSGTLNLATGPRNFGARFPMGDVGGTTPNCQIDRIDYATAGVLIDAGTIGSPATFDDIVSDDQGNTSNRYGVIIRVEGKDFVTARVIIADATATVFNDTPNIIFADQVFCASDWLGITVDLQNASTAVDFVNGSVETAPGATNRGDIIVTGTSGTFDAAGTNFLGLRVVTLTSAVTMDACTFNECGAITAAGADLNGCAVLASIVGADESALVWNVATDTDGLLDGIRYTKGAAAHHALELGTSSPTTVTIRESEFSGFNASNGQNDSAIYVRRTSGTVTINIVDGVGSTPSVKTDGATVVVNNTVTVSVTVADADTALPISGARVYLEAASGGALPAGDSVSITRSGSTATVTHTAHGLATGDKVRIRGATQSEYNITATITVTGVNSYTYAVSGTPATPATGSPTSTAVILDGDTNGSGVIQDSGFNYTADQPVVGRARKGTSSPFYKTGLISGTIGSGGFTQNVFLVSDE